jgi:hypothetical protein
MSSDAGRKFAYTLLDVTGSDRRKNSLAQPKLRRSALEYPNSERRRAGFRDCVILLA